MAGPSKAEMMLSSLEKRQMLISRLQEVLESPAVPDGIKPTKTTMSLIEEYRAVLRSSIEELTAKGEQTIAMIGMIPNPTTRKVLEARYGVGDTGGKVRPWLELPEILYLELPTLYRHHRRGIDYLDRLLEEQGSLPDQSRKGKHKGKQDRKNT